MAEYVSFPLSATDAPIDISFAFGNEKPAGKHGFLQVKGDKFVFEDGTPARFWGSAFNGAACFPEHDHAEKVARRLAKVGVNIVRLHQLDGDYSSPNIFQFNKGQRVTTTRKLDERSLERMDYFVYCLKQEGIYIYMDLLVNRYFKENDGVRNSKALQPGAKPWSIIDRRMIELQKEYAEQLFTHVNPYTGLAYVDEPAIALTDLVNETNMFCTRPLVEPYLTEFREGFRSWLKEEGIDFDVDNCTLFGVDKDEPLIRYKIKCETEYFAELRQNMKRIGVKIPITATNSHMHSGQVVSQAGQDFRDTHSYQHRMYGVNYSKSLWNEKEGDKAIEHFSLTQGPDIRLPKMFELRALDQPYFISEWNMTWPNHYRAEGPMIYAALGCLQGFGGYTMHTYSYQARQTDDMMLGKETYANAIDGVAYREGIFSSFKDPALFGLFYHASLMMRRGDVAEANRTIAVKTTPALSRFRADFLMDMPAPFDRMVVEKYYDRMTTCYYGMGETSKIGVFVDKAPEGVDEIWDEPRWGVDPSQDYLLSDNGQVYRSWGKNLGWIDSDRTKCVYGFLEKNGQIDLNGLSVECQNDYAVIAMSSLTDEALDKTDNIMLTTIGRACNKDAKFDGYSMVEWGTNPTQIEVIKATIKLKTDKKDMKVYSITPEGNHYGTVASTWEDGVLTFTVGEHWRSMYYLIQES